MSSKCDLEDFYFAKTQLTGDAKRKILDFWAGNVLSNIDMCKCNIKSVSLFRLIFLVLLNYDFCALFTE